MERLIADGVSADAKNGRGDPALALAAIHGHLDALKLLRKHGANLDATTEYHGHTALMNATSTGNVDCIKALLEWGADKDAAAKRGRDTALHCAARHGQLECARLLVVAGADQAKENSSGETALQLARRNLYGKETCAEVAALLEPADATCAIPSQAVYSALF